MSKLPGLDAAEAERLLLAAGFVLVRCKGSHRIYKRDNVRMVLPFHWGETLHPKIVRELFTLLEG
ncbi:MAG: type II toxin-antitoxin system HicA family toxin [Spirochaetes bacterium]|nr:type II toxin-antitoxin system HicA family toxin [Spirochaetota bacterium]